jgi:hypothetical protein
MNLYIRALRGFFAISNSDVFNNKICWWISSGDSDNGLAHVAQPIC